jgi:hypothetical protein
MKNIFSKKWIKTLFHQEIFMNTTMKWNYSSITIISFLSLLVMMIGSQRSYAQGVGISESSITPHASSILELRSTLHGFLLPRMTTAERDLIGSPATGLLLYNTTTNKFNYRNGSWIALVAATDNLSVFSATTSAELAGVLSDETGTGLAVFGTTPTLTTPVINGTISGTTIIPVANGGTGQSTYAIGDMLFASAATTLSKLADVAVGRVLISGGVGVAPSYSATPTLGVAGSTLGTLAMSGNTSGTITIQPQSATGTYSFNLPTTAGTSGQPLLSGGGATAMTFGTLGVAAGGTGLTSGTSGGILGFTAAGTLSSSSLLTSNALVIGGGPGAIPSTLAIGTANQILGMNSGATAHEYKTVTAGTMMTVTNAVNSITISANVANTVTAANQTTTVIAPTNVTGMSFNIGANETWSFEFNIDNGCNNTGGVKYAITVPAGGVLNATALGLATSLTTIQFAQLIVSGTLTAAGFNRVNLATGFTRIVGVVANGATLGTVQLQFASTTAGQTSTVFANSYLAARRVSP